MPNYEEMYHKQSETTGQLYLRIQELIPQVKYILLELDTMKQTIERSDQAIEDIALRPELQLLETKKASPEVRASSEVGLNIFEPNKFYTEIIAENALERNGEE